jgi:hypothetical protein
MLAGGLLAQFGTLDGLRAVVAVVRRWASRTGRTVEVSIGGVICPELSGQRICG